MDSHSLASSGSTKTGQVHWQPAPGSPTLTVDGADAFLYLDGVEVSRADLGILANSGNVFLDRSRVISNQDGAISLSASASLLARNSFLGSGDSINVPVISSTASTFELLYTTVGAGLGTSTALGCDAGAGSSARNSIIVTVGTGEAIACPGVDISYSALTDDTGFRGNGNVAVGVPAGWFENYDSGDFTLSGSHPFTETALWLSGDPRTDINGTARPTNDGDPDYPGADRP